MSLFNKCFDNLIAATAALPSMAEGEKGTMEYTSNGVGDARVALFFGLVRNTPRERVESLFADCIRQARAAIRAGNSEEAANIVADLFVLAFQTRDCRGGKGERQLFYAFLHQLYTVFPETVMKLVTLIPQYGYFKDYLQLAVYLDAFLEKSGLSSARPLQEHMMIEFALQLQEDAQKLASFQGQPDKAGISLCVKYAPREGKVFAKQNPSLFGLLLTQLFPTAVTVKEAATKYRRFLSSLTPAVNTVETKMCGKRFASIAFDQVPSCASKKYRKAFLNEKLDEAPTDSEFATGNRHPEDSDRIACRTHLVERVMAGKVNGKQLFPHEIVREIMKANEMSQQRRMVQRAGRGGKRVVATNTAVSSIELRMLCVQWDSLRNHVVSSLQEKKTNNAAPAIDLGRLVPLVDVSGSMAGEPMEVAIALGILISEINQPEFRNRFLTFETTPQWVQLQDSMSLVEKVRVTQRAPWGGSTNFNAAMKLIAEVVEANRLPMSEVPDMIVFSDMQFDAAEGSSSRRDSRKKATQLESIQKMFHDVGMRICGKPYPAPRIIFWNLRGNTVGFPAQATTSNVQMLSGYSPSLFKFVVEGVEETETPAAPTTDMDMDAPEESAAPVAVQKGKVDPYKTLRKVLDSERYFEVREVLSASTENELAHYHFEKPSQN